MFGKLSQKLYLRIWLAVVGLLLLVAIGSALGWRAYMENERSEYLANPPTLPTRELIVKNEQGDILTRAESKPGRRPGTGIEFEVKMQDGQRLDVILPPRQRPVVVDGVAVRGSGAGFGGPPPPGVFDWRWLPRWVQPPYSFFWVLLVVSVAIALGAYPVARKLTQRLEKLRDGVRKFGEGDLSARVEVRGRDEVGYLAEQFNASAQRVQHLIEAQKSLLANASHELRSPLARIRMGIEMLPPTAEMANERKIRTEIQHSIRELDELIEEILLSSKLDALKSGKSVDLGQPERVDLIGLCAEECARVGAELEIADGMQSLNVNGHPKLIVRMVRNLLENARRYSEGPVELTLTASRNHSAGTAKIRVCDHGSGVPVDQRERIFEPFYRLPGASERAGGVGLGLSLVKSIALQHRGDVICESRPDGARGACFTVTLPHD